MAKRKVRAGVLGQYSVLVSDILRKLRGRPLIQNTIYSHVDLLIIKRDMSFDSSTFKLW